MKIIQKAGSTRKLPIMIRPDEDQERMDQSNAEAIRISNLHRMRFSAPSGLSYANRPLPLPPSTRFMDIIKSQNLVQSIEKALGQGTPGSALSSRSRRDRDWEAHELRMKMFRSPPQNTRLPPSRPAPAQNATNQPSHVHVPPSEFTGVVSMSYDIERSRRAFEEERDRLRLDLVDAKYKLGKLGVLVEIVTQFSMNEQSNEQPVVEREVVDFGVDEDFVQRDWDP